MFRKFRDFEKGEFVVVAADTSSGLGDYCAAQFISQTKIDVPLVYHSKTIATEMTNMLYPALEKIFDITGIKPVVAYERNAGGTFEIERLASMNRLGKYTMFKMPSVAQVTTPEPTKYGWDTNTASRPAMLSQLKDAVDNKLLTIYDRLTIEEMYSFVVVRSSISVKAQAEAGCHDDLVMSLAIAWQLYQLADFQDIQSNQGNYSAYVQKNREIKDEDIGL